MNAREQRKFALRLFAPLLRANQDFAYALRHKCYDDIVRTAPPEAFEIVANTKEAPIEWALYVAMSSSKENLEDWVCEYLKKTPEHSYWVIRHSTSRPSPRLANEMWKTISTSPERSYFAIKDIHDIPPEIVDSLWKAIATSPIYCRDVIRNFPDRIPAEFKEVVYESARKFS